jgi:hypothetical protein
MASAWYPKGLEGLLKGEIDVDVDTFRVYLIDTADYTYSSAHDFLDDVAAGAKVANATLASVTGTNGAFDSADPTLSSVTGDQSEALIIAKWTGAEATSRLLLYIDSFTSGMPVTPNGGNIVITVPGSGWGTI